MLKSQLNLNDTVTRVSIGRNVATIVDLLGRKLSSIAAFADVEVVFINGLAEGRGKMTEDILQNLAGAFKSPTGKTMC